MINSDMHIKFRALFVIIVVNAILQATIFQALKFSDISANYTLVLVILITVLYGLESGLFTAIIGGLFIDIFFSMAIGLNLFILVIIALLVSIIGRPLFTGNKLTLVFMIGISTFLFHLMYFFFMYFLNKGVSLTNVMTHIVPIEIILNAIVCVIAYTVAIKWIKRYKLD